MALIGVNRRWHLTRFGAVLAGLGVLSSAGPARAGDAPKPPPLGNVFLTTDDAAIPVPAAGTTVPYKIRDLWDRVVAEGEAPAADGQAVIRPPAGKVGHFRLEVDGRPRTAFAVITPVDVTKMPDSPFGVMCHFAQGWDVDILPLVAKAGIGAFRDEHYWNHVETQRGAYAFSPASNRYMEEAKKLGLDPLIPMTFGNKLYDHAEGPSTPQGYEGYARYGEAILKQYGKQVRWLEVWNEYNGSWCPPAARNDRPKYYAEMIRHVYQYLKPKYPDVKILGGACVMIPLPYLEGLFKNGGLDFMDAVVIHPYRDVPEGVDVEVRELRELIRKYNKGAEKPVWATEVGSMEGDGRARASYLVRIYVLLLSEKVEKVFQYLMRNYANFPDMGLVEGPEHPFGRYAVKPPYVAYANLIRQLYGAAHARREAARKYTRAYVHLFRKGGEEIRVCWAAPAAKIELEARAPLTVVDLMGGTTAVAPAAGKIVLDLNTDAVYVKGAVESVKEIDAGPEVLADSVDDFSLEQGRDNWSYGYYKGDGQGQGDGAEPSGPYTDDDFKPMEPTHDEWAYKWKGPGEQWFQLTRGGGHPGAQGPRGAWPVLRWTSPVAGKVRIALTAGRGKQGDGIEVKVLVDGREVFSKPVGGSQPVRLEGEVAADVRKGTRVDVAVTPGPRKDTAYDAYSLRARISRSGD
jgi:hypothetical protein